MSINETGLMNKKVIEFKGNINKINNNRQLSHFTVVNFPFQGFTEELFSNSHAVSEISYCFDNCNSDKMWLRPSEAKMPHGMLFILFARVIEIFS